MKIRTITLERLVNLGNYESLRVSATAIVTKGEDPSKTLETLKDWMEEEIQKISSNYFSPSRFPGWEPAIEDEFEEELTY
jgi:hypothetical protein